MMAMVRPDCCPRTWLDTPTSACLGCHAGEVCRDLRDECRLSDALAKNLEGARSGSLDVASAGRALEDYGARRRHQEKEKERWQGMPVS